MWGDNSNQEHEGPGRLPTFAMLKKIHPYVRQHLGIFGLAFFLALLGVGFILAQPLIFKRIVDIDFPSGDPFQLMRSSLMYLGTVLFAGYIHARDEEQGAVHVALEAAHLAASVAWPE